MNCYLDVFGEVMKQSIDSVVWGEAAERCRREDGAVRFELMGDTRSGFHIDMSSRSLEVALSIADAPEISVVQGSVVPQLDAKHVLVQAEVASKEWSRGWVPLGGRWDNEVVLPGEHRLSIEADLNGVVTIWARGDELEFERSGTFPVFVDVRPDVL